MKLFRQINFAIIVALLSFTFNASGQLSISLTPSSHNGYNISCFGGRDGSIDITVSGGSGNYVYQWSNNSQAQNISGLQAGYYHVAVQDLNPPNDNVEAEFTLTQPDQLLFHDPVISSYSNGYCISLFGACNGSIQINPIGGAAPYSYLWGDGNASHNRWSLCQGQYNVTVTDANGCSTSSEHYYISEPPRSDWSMTGNSGINPSTQYLGTNDNTDFVFKTNSAEQLRLKSNGNVGINNNNPAYRLDVNGTINSSDIKIGGVSLSSGYWTAGGNTGSNPSTQFLGTTDNKDFVFKTNSVERMRIKNDGKLNFNGTASFDSIAITKPLKLDTLKINRIMASEGDSIIHFGIGSINFNQNTNTITATSIHSYGGIGIGDGSFGRSQSSIAIGLAARTWGIQALGFGNYVNSTGDNSLVIGSGINSNDYLVNSIPNSISIGSNSNVPSISLINGSHSIAALVGIATQSPLQQLHINGSILIDGSQADGGNTNLYFGNNTSGQKATGEWAMEYLHYNGNSNSSYEQEGLNFWKTSYLSAGNTVPAKMYALFINNLGNVGIGVDNTPDNSGRCKLEDTDQYGHPYKLSVNGSIRAMSVRVYLGWADYVFNNDYKLKPLNQLEDYIKENKHLPGVPTSDEINKTGVDLGNTSVKLLEKIEELTLYLIDLKNENDGLKNRIEKLELIECLNDK